MIYLSFFHVHESDPFLTKFCGSQGVKLELTHDSFAKSTVLLSALKISCSCCWGNHNADATTRPRKMLRLLIVDCRGLLGHLVGMGERERERERPDAPLRAQGSERAREAAGPWAWIV